MSELENSPCTDCQNPTPFVSHRFKIPLCRGCWEKRTGWDVVITSLSNEDTTDEELAELLRKVKKD